MGFGKTLQMKRKGKIDLPSMLNQSSKKNIRYNFKGITAEDTRLEGFDLK